MNLLNLSKKILIIHYQKINIFGEIGIGKPSLISHMENYDNDNFKLKENDLFKSNSTLDFNI